MLAPAGGTLNAAEAAYRALVLARPYVSLVPAVAQGLVPSLPAASLLAPFASPLLAVVTPRRRASASRPATLILSYSGTVQVLYFFRAALTIEDGPIKNIRPVAAEHTEARAQTEDLQHR